MVVVVCVVVVCGVCGVCVVVCVCGAGGVCVCVCVCVCRQKIGNFKTEPPGLFRGRGDHPKQGKIKVIHT